MKAQIVSFHCVVKDKMGRVLSSTYNHDVLTYDANASERLKGLIVGLQDLKKGEKRSIAVNAKDAFGFYDPERVLICSAEQLRVQHPAMKLGDKIKLALDKKPSTYRITEISGDLVTLDGNHPFAGQDLIFEIEATAARAALPDEVAMPVSVSEKESYH